MDHLEPSISRTRISSILDAGDARVGEHVVVGGWVVEGREQGRGAFAFFKVSDGSCPAALQAVVEAGVLRGAPLARLTPMGTSLLLEGKLKKPLRNSKERVELHVDRVIEVGEVDDAYPLHKSMTKPENFRDLVHLRARTNTISTVARIRHYLAYLTHEYFHKSGFFYVHTPIITTSDCEGAGEMFQITTLFSQGDGTIPRKGDGKIAFENDFFKRQAFLTVSGQLQDVMNYAESYIQYLCKGLLEYCEKELEFMDKKCAENGTTTTERLRLVSSTPFERISYTEAVNILKDAKEGMFENAIEWGNDLASEHERYLTETVFMKPVIVYNYPKEIKSFYMRLNDDQKTVAAMDVQ
ncbi:unnamed protein product [Miscanthus lutarioriparius]|uniref:Asparagine--tRNA ligase n=1 Tax=Miscanthus lutarioriparius TaxID=422564 RepID=A0A811SKU4_9POAL|nr:unnamed protein product [Miscanthus lutarioriparius]